MDSLKPQERLLLAILGLALVVLSLLALGYALALPVRVQEQHVPDPTLFVPPQTLLDGWRSYMRTATL